MPKVMLVVPPMLSVVRPSLGVSAIKAALADMDCSVEVFYASFLFAEYLGPDINQQLAEQTDHRLLLGEWIFSACIAKTPHSGRDAQYLESQLKPRIAPELLQAVVRAREHAATFVAQCAQHICAAAPAIVGLTSTFQQHCASLAIASDVKQLRPDITICLGGANCEGEMGRATLENFPYVDHVFSGESDRSFPKFVQQFFSAGAGSADRPTHGFYEPDFAEPVLDLDTLPVPDFQDYFAAIAQSSFASRVRPALTFEASRGCWWGTKHHCSFCGLNGNAIAFRSKSPERVLQEIQSLHQHWQVTDFSPSDNILSPRHIDGVFGKLPTDSPLRFFFEIKSNMSHEQLIILARGGVNWLQPGIESLCDSVLKLMNKGVSRLQNLRFLRSCSEIGLLPLWNFLVGFPGENSAEYRELAALIPYLEHLSPPQNGPSFLRVDRFSPYFNRSAPVNFDAITPLEAYPFVYDLPPEQLERMACFFQGHSTHLISSETHALLAQAIVHWREAYWNPDHHVLLSALPVGDAILVRDTRSIAREEFALLDAAEAQVLQRARAPANLDALLNDPALADATGSMLERGFLLRSGGQVLSLVKEYGWQVLENVRPDSQPCGLLKPKELYRPEAPMLT